MQNENNYLMYWVIRFSESLKTTPIVRSNEILFSLQYVVNSLILSTNFEIGAPICFRDENRSSWSSIKILFSYGNFFEIESIFDIPCGLSIFGIIWIWDGIISKNSVRIESSSTFEIAKYWIFLKLLIIGTSSEIE